MDSRGHFRQDGYQKGFDDARRTGGKISKKYMDNFLKTETRNLSAANSSEFIEGWHEGFTDGIGQAIFNSVKNDDFWKSNIYELR